MKVQCLLNRDIGIQLQDVQSPPCPMGTVECKSLRIILTCLIYFMNNVQLKAAQGKVWDVTVSNTSLTILCTDTHPYIPIHASI